MNKKQIGRMMAVLDRLVELKTNNRDIQRLQKEAEAVLDEVEPSDKPQHRLRNTAAANMQRRADAAAFREAVLPVIEELRSEGATTLLALSQQLDARGIKPRFADHWRPNLVRHLLIQAESHP